MAYEKLLRVIEEGRERRGLTERKMLLGAGVGLRAIYYMREKEHAPRQDTLVKLAKFLGHHPSEFFDLAAEGKPAAPAVGPLSRVLVRSDVQAGVWRESTEWPADEWYSVIAPADTRFPGVERFGLVVKGTSMDRSYPDGTIVIVVRFADISVAPTTGQRVVVLRRDRRSGEFEATLKEYERDDRGRHILWPRSSDPEFQTPIILTGQAPTSFGDENVPTTVSIDHSDQVGEPDIQIFALVVGSYRPE
jgi:transcriptional regulator with XRE-family HTH domain